MRSLFNMIRGQGRAAETLSKKIGEEWQITFDSITDLVLILDADLKIVRVNSAAARFFNLEPSRILGKPCFTLLHGTTSPPDICPVRAMLKTKQHQNTEIYHEKHGKWLFISVDPILDESGNLSRIVHIIKDITSRKQVEETLRSERMRFQSFLENAPFGIVILDRSGKGTYANSKFEELFGYDAKNHPDWQTWSVQAYPDPEYRKMIFTAWIEALKKAKPGEKFISYTPRLTCRNGTKKDANITCVRLPAGEVLFIMEDVTERKHLEYQLLQSQKMEAVGTLAGGIAHDFNNLLMTILGYTSLILMDTEPKDPKYEKLKTVESQVKSGANLTRQLLGFARGGKYETRTVDLNGILARSSEMFGRTKKEIAIHKKFEGGLWTVEADSGQIEQVFLNLFVNAWQAMPAGGELYLTTSNISFALETASAYSLNPGKYVKVSVTDTGTGMDETTRRRLFEPFFTTKEMGRGTGLGLASAYGIIKNHGGSITVYSEKGKGTTFNIYLPASGKVVPEEKEPPQQAIRGSETILLVDDQQTVLDVGKSMLEALGYRVYTAAGGREALEVYREQRQQIDLVILDMIMPGMSGGDAYLGLKEINPVIKAILSSGYSMNGDAVKILENGCNGFIQKPFNMSELSGKIREVLAGSPAQLPR